MNYCTVDDVVAHIQDPDANRLVLATIIEAVSRGIDRECRRHFYAVQEPRIYDWPQAGYLRLRDDLVSVVSVATNAGQSYAPYEVFLRPLGGPPFFQLWPDLSVGAFRYQTTPMNAITVTARWGFQASAPAPIKMATILWAAESYARSDMAGLDDLSSGDLELTASEVVEKPPPAVWALMKTFVKRRILSAGGEPLRATVLA